MITKPETKPRPGRRPLARGDASVPFIVRMPGALHRELLTAAEAQGISAAEYSREAIRRAVMRAALVAVIATDPGPRAKRKREAAA